jgi:hypothetical protein
LLNRAARYFPLLSELSEFLDGEHRVLEIGSGSLGLGQFYRHTFVGCDINFATKPRKPMLPVISSATRLPFPSQSFDAVISSDVMEHMPPQQRESLIAEALRVARKKAVFCFPCGSLAHAIDRQLLADYRLSNIEPPVWLLEHMQHPFPDADLFGSLPKEWRVTTRVNESLRFHLRIMRMEMKPAWHYVFRAAIVSMPGILRRILQFFDSEPCYRRIFIATRCESPY